LVSIWILGLIAVSQGLSFLVATGQCNVHKGGWFLPFLLGRLCNLGHWIWLSLWCGYGICESYDRSFVESVTFDESLFMSMWARMGRFLEIYGPKFWDFQWKSDFCWKSSDHRTRLMFVGPEAEASFLNKFSRLRKSWRLCSVARRRQLWA
jgi:hypothetical protein